MWLKNWGAINLLHNKWFRLKLKKANPKERAELMRDKFYYLGKNVELYTINFGTEPYLVSIPLPIMNVFSAHMDYGYRSLQPINNTLVGNKFGVSNVVFVIHEKNTEAIHL